MENTDGWSIDSDLSFDPLRSLGWEPEWLPWRTANADWNCYRAVYIAAAWDYPDDPEHFIKVLERIDASSATLVNDLSLVRWNIPKTYLRDLEARGAAIVPSLWQEDFDSTMLGSFFDDLDSERIIIKPVVSTNATHTFLLERDTPVELLKQLQDTFSKRAFVVQPFIENIQSEGEYSLFYFGNKFSHAIQKIPKARDFRVQEEYGAAVVSVEPEPQLLQTAEHVLSLVKPAPVYVRSDFVRGPDGRFLVMELELVEPSMYLRMDSEAPRRFAAAFDNYVRAQSPGDHQ